jgi:hypothetical protein
MTDTRRDQVIMEMHSSLSTLIAAVTKVETAINGNGKPGLLDRMTVIEERQSSCPAREAYKHGNISQSRANWISAGALAVAGLSLWRAIVSKV